MRTPRRYRLLGGIFGWRVPVVSLVLVLAAAWAREWVVVYVVSVIGLMAWEIDRAPVVEISRAGLARGFALPNGALAGAHIVSWRFVDAIETRWARPNDFTVLETIVRTPGGTVRSPAGWDCAPTDACCARSSAAPRRRVTSGSRTSC
jgi:hypothetical protein